MSQHEERFPPKRLRRSASKRAASLLLMLLWCAPTQSADPPTNGFRSDVPFADNVHHSFSGRQGLPSNWVNDIVQTRDGFVWIATDNGLVRYDGFEFKTFDAAGTELPYNEVRVLLEDQSGSLWIGTSKGLASYRPGRPGVIRQAPEFAGKAVFALFEDDTDRLLIGTDDETWVRGKGQAFKVADKAPRNVRAICQDRSGTLWLGSHFGLFRREGQAYVRIKHEKLPEQTSAAAGVPQARVNVLRVTEAGDLWIGTNRALLHMRDQRFTSRGQELGSQQVYDILPTAGGGLLLAARFGLYRSVDGGAFEEVSGEPSVFSLMEDREGGLWVGNGDNRGLHLYRNRHAQSVWNEARVRCVLHDSNDGLWFGSSQGLHRLRRGERADYGLDDGLPDRRVQTIVPAAGGALWIGTGKGFAKWSGSGLAPVPAPAELREMNIASAMEDSGGVLWFSLSSAGCFTLKDGALNEVSGLGGGRTHWFWEDQRGVVWIGHEAGLFSHDDEGVRKVKDAAFDQLLNPRMLCFCESDDGALWMGTSNGIVRYHAGRFEAFGAASGLRADNIERLASDDDGNLWFGGRDGLFYAPMAEFEAVAAGRLSKLTSVRVEEFARFPPVNAFSQGASFRGGILWLVGEGGLVKMPTGPVLRKPSPPVVDVEHVTLDGADAGFEDCFEFLAGKRRLAIAFAAPALANQHLQFRYRLDGHDGDWTDAGPKRSAEYTDLRPGRYTFRVAARNGNGAWVEAKAPVEFEVVPRWWESTLFLTAAGLAAAACVFGAVRHRLQKIRQANAVLRHEIDERKRAEEESRARQEQLARVSRAASMGEMATTIAHEIRQPLFAILTDARTAIRLMHQEEPDLEQVEEALQGIELGGNRASEIIDRIRSLVRKEEQPKKPLDLNGVVAGVVAFVQPELRRRGMTIATRLAADLPLVNGNEIELHQVLLNLVINGAQSMASAESDSRELSVTTAVTEDSVEVAVCDAGVGLSRTVADRLFEPFFTTKKDGTGMGLAINRTIIQAHGGAIWATQNETRGATFRFRIPAAKEASS